MQSLKRIRVVVAAIFILACTLLSLDIGIVLPIGLHPFFTSTQLIPSFLKTLVVLTVASLGLFFILAVTLFFGRVYCSAFCPLGILQDGIIRIAKRINKRRRFRYKKPSYALQYSLFILIVICTVLGSAILLDLFEPFSNYGRIISLIFNPMIHILNNGMEYILGFFGINILSRVSVLPIHVPAVLASLSFLVFIIYLSYRHGRLFCNLLCPAGAFLGLFSRFSLFEIVIDKNNCKECGLCERVCKAQCIQSSKKEIDFAACIGCFNCIAACPTVGMSYKRRWRKISDTSEVNTGRRKVLKIAILPAVGFLMQKTGAESLLTAEKIGYEENKKNPASPPGSKSIERYANLCTACHVCIHSCPTGVLQPSFLEYGISGIFQPKMNYDVNYCNYDCVLCGQVCPTGAILPMDALSKQEVQIGKAQFVRDDCIVVKNNKDCGACSEHCPTKAVSMIPYGKNLMIPEINNDICVGCGACEHACPVQPMKAIYVKANRVHQKASKPKTKKAEPSFESSQEFPF